MGRHRSTVTRRPTLKRVSYPPGLQVAQACVELIGLPDRYAAPLGYDGLALAIIDAIWSMGVRYQGVANVLDEYRGWTSATFGCSAALRTSNELLDDIAHVGGPAGFATDVVHNLQRTSTRGGVLKSAAVAGACAALVESEVLTADNLRKRAFDDVLRKRWLAVHGQGSGISWRYALMNVKVEDLKPDRMICRFVAQSLHRRSVSPENAHDEVLAAYELLLPDNPRLTLRALDHEIWEFASGRTRRFAHGGSPA